MTVIGLASIISMLKDIAVTIAAIIGAVVAWQGLSAWKWQLTCQTEYELARRLLRATYKYREAISLVRCSIMSGSEMPEPPEDSPLQSPDQKDWYGTAHGYEKRWEHLSKAHSELNAELLEAEVLWDKGFCAAFSDLFLLENELYRAVINFVQSKDPRARIYRNPQTKEEMLAMWEVLYAGDIENDIFRQKITTTITNIEDALKPFLKLNEFKRKGLFRR